MTGRLRVGLTLPSFARDVDEVLAIARAADDAGLDGVFGFDHLFRRDREGRRRPALEATTLLGTVAAHTTRIQVGTLVFRAALRPPPVLASAIHTAARIAPGRVIAGLGAGDSESLEENVAFGLAPDSPVRRVEELHRAVLAVRDQGVPVWVGGTSRAVRALAVTEADGWNRWGGTPDAFESERAAMSGAVSRRPFTWSWGGLVVLGASDADAADRAHRLGASPGTLVGGPVTVADGLARWRDAGADWIVLGPVDSRRVENVGRLASDVVPRLA